MLAVIPLFGHMKILHTPVGMSSAALAVAVPYLGKGTTNFPQGTMKYKERKKGYVCTPCVSFV